MPKSEQLSFEVNSVIYPLEAILATAYVFLDRFYLFLDEDKGKIKISLKPKKGLRLNLNTCQGEFRNELLNSALRCAVSKNNRKIREFIIGRVLYSSLYPSDLSAITRKLDYQEDPQGISIPWEEKYGKKKNAKSKI